VRPGQRRVAILGAGMVGVPTGWFLQELGANVTAFERRSQGAEAGGGAENLYEVEVDGGHIWHLSLTNPAGDRELRRRSGGTG
jgi:glycine/D-amino acid oxidase-like deaminating enzyme